MGTETLLKDTIFKMFPEYLNDRYVFGLTSKSFSDEKKKLGCRNNLLDLFFHRSFI